MGTGFLDQERNAITMHDRDFARKGIISWNEAEKLTESQLSANHKRWDMESIGFDEESRDWGRDLNR
jgi:hypothetical protein